MTNDENKPSSDIVEAFRQGKRAGSIGETNCSREVDLTEAVQKLAKEAKNETVTSKRLIGDEKYFTEVLSFLEEQEQPHFLFPLTKGLMADSALVVESGAKKEELLTNTDGGSCVITNRYIRVVGTKGEWTIPYNSVVSVDFVGYPALHVQTSGRTYYIKIAGTFFNEEQNISDAATYIREKQRESTPNYSDSSKSPLEKLKELAKYEDKGLITTEEFENKKRELLEEV